MNKIYRSGSIISPNIILKDGTNRHLPFTEISGGKSMYSTCDKRIQDALESSQDFGTMYVLAETNEQEPPKDEEKNITTQKQVQIPATDLSDAREKIVDRTGISRTKIGRTKESIETLAKANGIELKWAE